MTDRNVLKKEILLTLAYFDIFSYPLSSFQILKFLKIKSTYSDILDVLEDLKKENKISEYSSFWFLQGKDNLSSERFKKFNYFKRKIKKAKKFSYLISVLPFVRAIFVSNIIGDHNLKNSSDIDFLIITSSKRIWLARFFCTIIAKFLGLRPNKKTKKDKICLSFYISEDALNLENQILNEKDFYFIYWLSGLDLIFSKNNIDKFFYQENQWIKKYLPNFSFFSNDFTPLSQNKKSKNFLLFNFLEKILKKLQIKIMPKKLREQSQISSGVILGDKMIKLFLEDKRFYFIEKYESIIREMD